MAFSSQLLSLLNLQRMRKDFRKVMSEDKDDYRMYYRVSPFLMNDITGYLRELLRESFALCLKSPQDESVYVMNDCILMFLEQVDQVYERRSQKPASSVDGSKVRKFRKPSKGSCL